MSQGIWFSVCLRGTSTSIVLDVSCVVKLSQCTRIELAQRRHRNFVFGPFGPGAPPCRTTTERLHSCGILAGLRVQHATDAEPNTHQRIRVASSGGRHCETAAQFLLTHIRPPLWSVTTVGRSASRGCRVTVLRPRHQRPAPWHTAAKANQQSDRTGTPGSARDKVYHRIV